MPRTAHSPIASMLLAAILFASMGVLIKLLHRLPTWEIVFFRSVINFSCLLPWWRQYPLSAEWRKEAWILILRGVAGCLSMFLLFYAIENMKLADAMMLNYSSPIYVLLFSAFLLGESLNAVAVGFLFLAFIG